MSFDQNDHAKEKNIEVNKNPQFHNKLTGLSQRWRQLVILSTNWNNAGMVPIMRILQGSSEVIVEVVIIKCTKFMGGIDRAD